MDFKEIKELIHLVDQSSLMEFTLSEGGFSIGMSKNSRKPTEPSEIPSIQTVTTPTTLLPLEEKPEEGVGELVTAPIVGLFYSSPGPGKPPFKSPGDRVEKGDVLCIIEAMKVMNEITSQFSGTVSEVLAANEAEVEFGQPLFRIV